MTLDLLVVLAVAVFLFGMFWKLEDQRRQDETERLVDWLASPRTQATLDEITDLVAENQHILGRHHAAAQDHHRAGQVTTAVERMRLGCTAIEQLAPDYLRALHRLRHLAGTTAVIVPLPPLQSEALRAPELRRAARLGRLAHDLLVTGSQQTRLRLLVLEVVFRVGVRSLRRATERLPWHDDEWARVDALVADLALCGNEGVILAKRVLAAVDATENDL